MLLRGSLIATQQQALLIRQHGYHLPATAGSATAFANMAQLADRLGNIFQDVSGNHPHGILNKRIISLARDFVEIADGNPDAAFAYPHLNIHHSYLVVHSLMAATVSARLALAKGLDSGQRLSLVCAALTHDFGILPIASRINSSDPLKADDLELVHAHVTEGIRMLRQHGVDDPLWLEAIAHHHEFLDGSGYTGKSGDDIPLTGRILALADSYSAMLRPRPYRDRIIAREALETLYATELHRYDGFLIETLIWDFGFYPPGSLLRLANREMAVSIRNTPGILDSPQVAMLTDAQGRPLAAPAIRDTNDPAFTIVGTLDPSMAARAGRLIEKCWQL